MKLDSKYLTSLILEVINENKEDKGYLQKLFSLVASGNVEQAFDLADSLDMEKELIQRLKEVYSSEKLFSLVAGGNIDQAFELA